MTVGELRKVNYWIHDDIGYRSWIRYNDVRKGKSLNNPINRRHTIVDGLISYAMKQVVAMNVNKKNDDEMMLPACLSQDQFEQFITFIKTSYGRQRA